MAIKGTGRTDYSEDEVEEGEKKIVIYAEISESYQLSEKIFFLGFNTVTGDVIYPSPAENRRFLEMMGYLKEEQ